MYNSPRFSVNGLDIQKVLKGLGIGLAGVVITLLGMLSGINFHFIIGQTDMGPILSMVVATLISALVNLLRKYIADNSAS